MRKGSRIGVGLLLLIPVGFAIKWWFQPETLLLFSIVVSLAINIVTLNVMSDLVDRKGNGLLSLYSNVMILPPALLIYYEFFEPDRLVFLTISLVVLAYFNTCVLVGLKLQKSEKNSC